MSAVPPSTEDKLQIGKDKKAAGDDFFRKGDFKGGVIMSALTGTAKPEAKPGVPQPKTEADDLLEKIWNENNTKAKYRKAKALAGQGYTEKAIDILEVLLKNDPNDAGIKKDLADIKASQSSVEKKGLSKFKGMYNRPAKEDNEKQEEEVEEIRSPGVVASS
ncbi:hypothetical protein CTheo_428 [Ceratobasidium theobromae]|uniref:Uncharacterized protein n=1 Tax=Ceratobasidium theobromae TaxID=1582974 RepID=A0A5N5QYP8_9AGAM|nr:hypothetical protein CTheo_428 [Ceratobasidium theobromae]